MGNKKSKTRKKKANEGQDNAGEDVDLSDDSSDMDSDVSMNPDSSSDSSTEEVNPKKKMTEPKPSTSRVIDDSDSSSGDETCEKCAICLRLIKSQEVGSPEGCDHIFCAVCVIEWSKNSNVCPLDRQPFTIILVRKNKDGKVVRQVAVEEPRPIETNFEFEDDTFCEICGGSDREDRILLCDGCDRGYHTYCLNPPLENIPDEDEWYCPDCFNDTNVDLAEEVHMYADELSDLLLDAETTPSAPRSLRPRNSLGRARTARTGVRTSLFERIRQNVLSQVESHRHIIRSIAQNLESSESSADSFMTSDNDTSINSSDEDEVAETESRTSESQPGPSGLQRRTTRKTVTKAKPKTTKRKTGTRTTKKRKTATRKGKTTKRKTTATKRKTRKVGTKRKTVRRRKTTSTKKIKIENEDGTITEKIITTKRTLRRRRKAGRRRKTKKSTKAKPKTFKKRVQAFQKPKTVKGRLALTLGMVPPKKPGQLLPDVKIKPKEARLGGIDLNRARAGIPTLHIFEPRDELQYYSSGSDDDDFGGGDDVGGGIAIATRYRSYTSTRILDRKEAAKMYRSSTATAKSKTKSKSVVMEQNNGSSDILGSILESQSIWHSKDTDVKINFDGSIEYIRDKRPDSNNDMNSKPIDVREGNSDEKSTKAPMYPGSGNGSNSGSGNFQYNRNNYGGQRGGQDGSFSSGSNVNMGRFGAPRNDREGYANYLNNMQQGPAPFCRGGPPLSFRMPPRPQLRRIQFPARNRPNWPQQEEGGDEGEEEENVDGEEMERNENEDKKEEDDVDLYSDIENPSEKEEGGGNEGGAGTGGGSSYPAIAPPPEPSAFLLGIDENGEIQQEKDKSDVYDPAEPCDSDDEMVIDEKHEEEPKLPTEEKKEVEEKKDEEIENNENNENIENKISKDSTPAPSPSPERIRSPKERPRTSTEDDDEDCPIFSIYSSVSREFSQKEEEEREREIAEEKRKVEELKAEQKAEETARLSFDFEDKIDEKSPSKSRSVSPEKEKTPEREKRSSSSESECSRKSLTPKSKSKSDSESDAEKPKKESETSAPKIATGLEGLDVEEVSSENGDGDDFADKRSLSSLSLSDLSRRSRSPIQSKKKKKKRRKTGKKKNYEEGEIDDSDKRKSDADGKNENEEIGNENKERKRRRSRSQGSDRQVLSSKENKKQTKDPKNKDKDLSWKKPSKKDKNYREGKRRSKDRRSRSRSRERRKSRSPSSKKDKKKNKDRKKKSEKKKEIERYDVRKIVKNKEVRKTDAFGRDIISKSRSKSVSRSRSPIRDRTRNMLRRDSRSFSRSRSRSFRRGRSPVRRRYRSRSRSKSIRRSFSRSRSRSPRKTKKKIKSKERLKNRSRSRRKSRSLSRGRRRSLSRSRSRSPVPRLIRSKKVPRARRSWSHHISRSPSLSPRRSRTVSRSPIRIRRSYSRSLSTSWSRGRSPLARATSLEKLTVVLTTKDKKKNKRKKEGKSKDKEERRKKKSGNSKEVFASGDNVLVSVNFRNNNTNNSSNLQDERLGSLSPVQTAKKKRDDFPKKKKSSAISKNVVDAALSNVCPKRAKKLTRLSEKDAEVILNRKPVAVIDLDMSPYREQTPSPVNVVVVSDSGSGDEGKEQTPQRQRQSPGSEIEKSQENVPNQVNVSAPSSPVTNGYLTSSGPKTPPEPQIKFSINKPQQLRQIANPLGDDEDDDGEEEEEERTESLDRRIEKELEGSHKGPNTPPEPRGPTTPPSSQTSPDAYDPFEPTKSRSPSPTQDKENRPSPKPDQKDEQTAAPVENPPTEKTAEEADKIPEIILDSDDKTTAETPEKGEAIPVLDGSAPAAQTNPPVTEAPESPERKISVVITTPQNKAQPQIQKPYTPILKTLPMAATTTSSNVPNLTVTPPVFSLPSPTKTSRSTTATTQTLQVTGIQRLQHRLGSPVNRTPNSIKSTPEKRLTPRTNESNESYVRSVSKRNGEAPKQPRPLQDATNETIDMTIDMEDSPYSPASSEGDDLFDPPVETTKPAQKPAPAYKPQPAKPQHKSPAKQLSKFDLLFGPSGPQVSPVKAGNKKAKPAAKNSATPAKTPAAKTAKKSATKKHGISLKMDEDQLRILDELPSSAVELQVKDKFLKKLNRQERVVDEVKTVLKPHYARKHITKEEYKDILRRAVPKICHSKSGEINPSKIQSLIEAYVRKFRHAKKKSGSNAVTKPKTKKTMFS